MEIDEQVVFDQLDSRDSAIWSLLLTSGYLCAESAFLNTDSGRKEYDLALANKEIRLMFGQMVRDWFREYTPSYSRFVKALLAGNIREMNHYMNRVALDTFSFFDSGNRPSEKSEPERFYHGLVLGLLVELRGVMRSFPTGRADWAEMMWCWSRELLGRMMLSFWSLRYLIRRTEKRRCRTGSNPRWSRLKK